MELMILLGIIMVIILTILFFSIRPTDESLTIKADSALQAITDYANQAYELGQGNSLRTKIEIPSGVRSIEYDKNGLKVYFKDTELHRPLKRPLVGVLAGDIEPGIYDIIMTSYNSYICSSLPNQDPNDICKCDKPIMHTVDRTSTGPYVTCDVNGIEQLCDDEDNPIGYDTIITGLHSLCTNEEAESLSGRMQYSVINRKGEVIYENTIYSSDENSYFNLSDMNYVVNYSGPLTFRATCLSECYDFGSSSEQNSDYINISDVTVDIPYGKLITFLIDNDESLILDNTNLYFLVNPEGSSKSYYQLGRVKEHDTFIVRTGYKCVDGECINVDATLYHGGYEEP